MSVEKVTREERNPKYSRRITRSNNHNDDVLNNDLDSNQAQKSDISIINSGNRFEVIYTDIDKVRPYNEQARTYFDESEIIALSKTIIEHGIRQPLTVIGTDEGFQVVSGERRLRAAKLAGLKKVPIIIISDDKKAEELSLIENIQRKDLQLVSLLLIYNFSKTSFQMEPCLPMVNIFGVTQQFLCDRLWRSSHEIVFLLEPYQVHRDQLFFSRLLLFF